MPARKALRLASAASGFFAITILMIGCASDQGKTQPSRVLREAHGAKRAIVFVHGVFGSADSTWRNSKTGVTWPDLLLTDQDFDGYSIYLLHYPTSWSSGSPTIPQIAEKKLDELKALRLFQHKQIYFIAHSMGGLVTKRMLVQLNSPDLEALGNLDKVKAVMTLSTPSRGALSAEVAREIIGNPQLSDMARDSLNSFLQSLSIDWKRLRDKRPEGDLPGVFCTYETVRTGPIMIVGSDSAIAGCDESRAFGLDHGQMSKPASQSDGLYEWAKNHIRKISSLPAQTGRVAALTKTVREAFAQENLTTLSDLAEHGEAEKGSVEKLYNVIIPRIINNGERITALVIDIRPSAHYSAYALLTYLDELGKFSLRHVVFLESRKYRGWMTADDLRKLIMNDGGRITELINHGDFNKLERAGMVTRKIKVETNSWIRDAPRMLEQTQMPYAALVDSQDEFIGIISRSRISEAIQTALDQLGGR